LKVNSSPYIIDHQNHQTTLKRWWLWSSTLNLQS